MYYVSVTTVGGIATDWANDGVFGDGWYLAGIGTQLHMKKMLVSMAMQMTIINAFVDESGDEDLAAAVDAESEDYDPAAAIEAVKAYAATVADDADCRLYVWSG